MCERELDNGRGSSFSLNRLSIGCFAKSFEQNWLFSCGQRLLVNALLTSETNKCMHCVALAVREALFVLLLNGSIYCG